MTNLTFDQLGYGSEKEQIITYLTEFVFDVPAQLRLTDLFLTTSFGREQTRDTMLLVCVGAREMI